MKVDKRFKDETLKKNISIRVYEKDLELILQAKNKIDINIPVSRFLRFLIKESLHFNWHNKTTNTINN